jgi:nicotinamide-nucleotide amidase
MKALMKDEVLPRAKAYFGFSGAYHETLMTQGIGESWLADKIEDWENRIYRDGLSLAYLPSPGVVKLRLTAKDGATKANLIKDYFDEITRILPKYAYGLNGESIFETVTKLLRNQGKTLSTVESCTGGGLSNAFVQISGASDIFEGGFVTYSNSLKSKLANVSQESLEKYGAVSQQVVTEMADGGRLKLQTDYCVAISGIAGPDGGTEDKPVGTVWIAISSQDKTIAKCFRFGNDRGRNIEISMLTAANMLRRLILNIPED